MNIPQDVPVDDLGFPMWDRWRIQIAWREDKRGAGEHWDGRNSCCPYMMFREPRTMPDLILLGWERYEKILDQKGADGSCSRDKHPHSAIIQPEYLCREAWIISWFGHWTFDVGQTDREALASFGEYVLRCERYNHDNYKLVEYTGKDGQTYHSRRDPISLMGAEDRWRWTGHKEHKLGDMGPATPPPCRCQFCKAQGRLTVNH